ncbi:MAG: phosphatidylglycerophosphatase A [Deltaproteobacteria bacterium]|nr:phosphatidylglycerophosphatase A [Deltaproteobacteria bacterium]
MRSLVLFLASGGYLGYIPFASGTWGTLVGIPLFLLMHQLQLLSPAVYVALFVALVAGACWIAGQADVLLNEHDSHKIVIDEIVGYLAATLFLEPTVATIVAAFFIFRVLDVIKPFPAGYIDQHFPGGYGVTLDDVVSGVYTNLVVRLLILLGLPYLG